MSGGGLRSPTLGEVGVDLCLKVRGAVAVFLCVALSRYP